LVKIEKLKALFICELAFKRKVDLSEKCLKNN